MKVILTEKISANLTALIARIDWLNLFVGLVTVMLTGVFILESWAVDDRILFMSRRDGTKEVFVMNADGTNPINLTNDPKGHDYAPVWSPDHIKIAFTSSRDLNDEIYVMNADGTNQVNLTNNADSADSLPCWSPDGTMIAYNSTSAKNPGGEGDIIIIKANGKNVRNMTSRAGWDLEPAWSPDGKWIIWSPGIWISDIEGKNKVEIDNNIAGTGEYRRVSWSPDGTKIAFNFWPGGRDAQLTRADIWIANFVIDKDGKPKLEKAFNLTAHNSWSDHPVWSPDGSKIAFDSDRDGNWEVYVKNSDGTGEAVNLSNNPSDDRLGAWCSYSQSIAVPSLKKAITVWGEIKRQSTN